MIYAGLYGIENKLDLPQTADINFYKADEETVKQFKKLPDSLAEAKTLALGSKFVAEHLPESIISIYCK